MCGCTTHTCPAPHLKLHKDSAKPCLLIWIENWQCYKKNTGIEKAPVGEEKGDRMERGRVAF